jgi:hypothetical protein
MVCKQLYLAKLEEQISDTAVFEQVKETREEILKRHEAANKRWSCDHFNRLPYLYGVFKPTKRNFRWIAGTSKEADPRPKKPGEKEKPRASVYAIARRAVGILRVVMDTLRMISSERHRVEGIRTCWYVESLEEVAMQLRRLPEEVWRQPMRTVNFTTMYTNLPHDELLAKVRSAVAEAWDFHKERTGSTPLLGEEGWNTGVETYTLEEVMEILRFLVTNSFVCNGGHVRKQVRGIPMGLAVSPQLANLYCYAVEREFAIQRGAVPDVAFR